jgi:hypothetical protein
MKKLVMLAMLSGLLMASIVSAQIYPSGMVGYWKFDGDLTDQLGMYDGTIGPYGSYTDGLINQGLYCAPGCSNPYAARVDNFPNLDSFTVEAWIKPSASPRQASLTVTKWQDTGSYNGYGFILFTNPEGSGYRFIFQLRDNTPDHNYISISSPSTYSYDNWHHVVAIRDYGNEVKLFVNGEEVANALDTIGSIENEQALYFHGFTSGGCGWDMSAITMDEVALYDRVLYEAEIQQHYQDGLQGLGYGIVVVPVSIDIIPRGLIKINPRGGGLIPVVILTDNTFDATNVDPATVLFGASVIKAAPVDVVLKDVDGDGDTDMILHFITQETGIQCGDTSAFLTGKTFDGVPIEGSDSIKTAGCGLRRLPYYELGNR